MIDFIILLIGKFVPWLKGHFVYASSRWQRFHYTWRAAKPVFVMFLIWGYHAHGDQSDVDFVSKLGDVSASSMRRHHLISDTKYVAR